MQALSLVFEGCGKSLCVIMHNDRHVDVPAMHDSVCCAEYALSILDRRADATTPSTESDTVARYVFRGDMLSTADATGGHESTRRRAHERRREGRDAGGVARLQGGRLERRGAAESSVLDARFSVAVMEAVGLSGVRCGSCWWDDVVRSAPSVD